MHQWELKSAAKLKLVSFLLMSTNKILHIINCLQKGLYFALDKVIHAWNIHANGYDFQLHLMIIFLLYALLLETVA